MKIYILDTNLFFNMEAESGLGKTTEEVVKNLCFFIKELKNKKRADFFMSPRAVDEFLSFFEDKNQDFIKDLLALINIKSPDQSQINFSAQIFYQLVGDIRERSYRGLRIGEEEIKKAGELMKGKGDLSKKDFEIQIGAFIKKFRERYRNATRTGFLDSVADLDCIVLAKEQNGYVISADEGVLSWARIFGVRELPVGVWKKQMSDLLQDSHLQE